MKAMATTSETISPIAPRVPLGGFAPMTRLASQAKPTTVPTWAATRRIAPAKPPSEASTGVTACAQSIGTA